MHRHACHFLICGDKISLCYPSRSGTLWVTQAGLKLPSFCLNQPGGRTSRVGCCDQLCPLPNNCLYNCPAHLAMSHITCLSTSGSCRCSVISGKGRGGEPWAPPPHRSQFTVKESILVEANLTWLLSLREGSMWASRIL